MQDCGCTHIASDLQDEAHSLKPGPSKGVRGRIRCKSRQGTVGARGWSSKRITRVGGWERLEKSKGNANTWAAAPTTRNPGLRYG